MTLIERNVARRAAIAVLVVAVTMGGAAQAATLTNTASWGDFDTEVGFDIFVPQFNPALGTLTAVSVSLAGQFTPAVSFDEAPPPSLSPVEFNPQVQLLAVSQGFGLFGIDITQSLAPEFATIGSDQRAVGTPEAVDIGTTLPLTGSPVSYVGLSNLDFFGGGSSGVGPAYGRYVVNDQPQVTGQLAITYTFTPAPEPASLALLGVGLLGLCAIRPRARR